MARCGTSASKQEKHDSDCSCVIIFALTIKKSNINKSPS